MHDMLLSKNTEFLHPAINVLPSLLTVKRDRKFDKLLSERSWIFQVETVTPVTFLAESLTYKTTQFRCVVTRANVGARDR